MSISKRNKRGFFIVLILLLIVSYTPRILNAFEKTSVFKISHQQLLESDKELVEKSKRYKKKKKKYTKKKKSYKRVLEKIDPNLLTKEDWMNLGLSDKQSTSLLRFAKRGLKSNEDLKKIYVLPDELYNLIADSMMYPSAKNDYSKTENSKQNKVKIDFTEIELNQATQEELETIPGIGPFFAKNIIKRRSELGGFSNKMQLLEIWKFDQIKYDEIQKFVFVDKTVIHKINVNLATIDELKKHPYISYKVANSIVKMREMRGEYDEVIEIQESKLIDQELYIKLVPYIEL